MHSSDTNERIKLDDNLVTNLTVTVRLLDILLVHVVESRTNIAQKWIYGNEYIKLDNNLLSNSPTTVRFLDILLVHLVESRTHIIQNELMEKNI